MRNRLIKKRTGVSINKLNRRLSELEKDSLAWNFVHWHRSIIKALPRPRNPRRVRHTKFNIQTHVPTSAMYTEPKAYRAHFSFDT